MTKLLLQDFSKECQKKTWKILRKNKKINLKRPYKISNILPVKKAKKLNQNMLPVKKAKKLNQNILPMTKERKL